MPHAFWKGYLKLSLVTCAVELAPATTESDKVRFHTLNENTGNRVVNRYFDAVTHKAVPDKDQVRAFEKAEGDYIILTDDELDAVALESTRTIDIDKFLPQDMIEPVWYEKPYFLSPADKVGQEAFSVIQAAMSGSAVYGLARLVLYRRERAVLLVPQDRGLILWTLRYGDEVRDASNYFATISGGKPASKMVSMIRKVMRNKTVSWRPDILEDPVQKNLKSMIAAKKKKSPAQKKRKPGSSSQEQSGNVIDIMEALRKSLAREKGA